MELSSKRLVLRPFKQGDTLQAHACLSDVQCMAYIEPSYTLEQSTAFVEKYAKEPNPPVYALVEKPSQELIGHFIFHPMDEKSVYEMGFLLRSDKWNLGYASEMAQVLIEHAFEKLGIQTLLAYTIEANKASIATLEKLGFAKDKDYQKPFVFEGQVQTELCFLLHRKNYINNSKFLEG